MHINMKYYVVTIGAIFIALGIGMLVGFNLNYDQELSEQQANVINDLDSKFENLRETNDTLEESLVNLTSDYDNVLEFINKNSEKLLADSLLEKNIGIISTYKNNDYTNEVETIITKSSGNVAFNVLITENIQDKEKLQQASLDLNEEFKSSEDLIKYIALSVRDKEGKNKLDKLQELELIQINSISDKFYDVNSLVLAGGSENEDKDEVNQKIYSTLISTMKENNINTVGIQKTNAKYSDIELYSKNKIATIDNIDEGIGQVTLVRILNDNQIHGNFGRADSADKLLP